MENIFVEFLPPWVETGLQPAFYDKESGSVLQQTARMYARVNMLIRMFNKLSKETKETVENYIQEFDNLYTYVHNYFDNLDVQEEINNKIDAMYDDGTLGELLRNVIDHIYFDTTADMLQFENFVAGDIVKTLGYASVNDGGASTFIITDDSLTADNKAIYEVNDDLFAVLVPEGNKINVKQFGMTGKSNYDADLTYLATYVHDNAISEVDFNKETYNTTQYTEFNVVTDQFKMDFNGGTIKLNSSFRYYMYGIFTIHMDKDKESRCIIINGNFDGSGNPADFSNLNVEPKGGRGMFFIDGARYIKADNLNFNDWFYSACLWSHYCESADITNINGVRVGGRSADNTEDARGDALYFGYVGVVYDENDQIDVDNSHDVNINISNCHFSSWEAIPTLYPGADTNEGRNGCQSGRAGIVLGEYSRTYAKKVFNIEGCSFYNYQRTLHIENIYGISVNVKNTIFSEYGQALLMSANDQYDYINFDNCQFIKTVDVIAVYNDYKFLVSGFTTNNCKQIKFNNCTISDEYDSLLLLGKDIKFVFENCNITMERFRTVNDIYMNFIGCSIKFNQNDIYRSGFYFDDCEIESGYKHDTNSKSFLYVSPGGSITKNNYIKNCRLTNVGVHNSEKKLIVDNSELNYNSNFVNSDNAGTTRNYFFSLYNDKLESFSNNIVKNTGSAVYTLMDSSNNGTYQIHDNKIINCRLGSVNATGYKSSVYNNKFINDTAPFSTAVSDLYGSKIVWHDNIYLGYTTAMSNFSGATQYNNYTSPDGTTNTLIS